MLQPSRRPERLSQTRQRLRIGAIALTAVIVTCLIAPHARAQDAGDPAAGGALILQGKGGVVSTMPAVRLGTDMDVSVSGQIMRVRVTQAFRNTSDKWMEATYLYPLPDDGAVDARAGATAGQPVNQSEPLQPEQRGFHLARRHLEILGNLFPHVPGKDHHE